MNIDEIKKEISTLTLRQSKVEKGIQAANAKHEAHMNMLRDEFQIESLSEIDTNIAEFEKKISDSEKIILENIEKMKVHVVNLENLLNG